MADSKDVIKVDENLLSQVNKMLAADIPNKFWERAGLETNKVYSDSYRQAFIKSFDNIKAASRDFEKAQDMDGGLITDLGKMGLTQKVKSILAKKLFNESARNMYLEDEIIIESKLSSKDAYTDGIAAARKKIVEEIYKIYSYTGVYNDEGRLFAGASDSQMLANRIQLWNTVKVADVFKFFSKDEMSSFIGGGSLAFKTNRTKFSTKFDGEFGTNAKKIFGNDFPSLGGKQLNADANAKFNLGGAKAIGSGSVLLWSTLATKHGGKLDYFPIYLKLPARVFEGEFEMGLGIGVKASITNSDDLQVDEKTGYNGSYLDSRLVSAMYSGKVKTLKASPVFSKSDEDDLILDGSTNRKNEAKRIFGDKTKYYMGDEYKYMTFTDALNGNVLAREYSYPDIEATFFNKQLQLSYGERAKLKKTIDSLKGEGVVVYEKEQKYAKDDLLKYPFYKESKAENVYGLKLLETSLKINNKAEEIVNYASNTDAYKHSKDWYQDNVVSSDKFPLMHLPKVVNKVGGIDIKCAIAFGLYRMGGASSTKTIMISLPFSTKLATQHNQNRDFSSATDSLGKVFQDSYKGSKNIKLIEASNVLENLDKTNLLKNYRSGMTDYVDALIKSDKLTAIAKQKHDDIDFIKALTDPGADANKVSNYNTKLINSPSFAVSEDATSSATALSMDNAIQIDISKNDYIFKQFSFVNYIKNGEIQEFKGNKEKVSKFLYADINLGSTDRKKDSVDDYLEKDCYLIATERNSAGYVSFNGGWELGSGRSKFDEDLSNVTIGSSIPISNIRSLFVKTGNLFDNYNIDFLKIFENLNLELTDNYAVYSFSAMYNINSLEGMQDLYKCTGIDKVSLADYIEVNVTGMSEWINFVLNDYSKIFNNVKFDSNRNFLKKAIYNLGSIDHKSFNSWLKDRFRKFDDSIAIEFKTYLSTLTNCSKEIAKFDAVDPTSTTKHDEILKATRECVTLANSIHKKVTKLLEKIKILGINHELNGVVISESHVKLINIIKMSTESHLRLFFAEMASVTEKTGYSAEASFEIYCMMSECISAVNDFSKYASNACLPIDHFISLLSDNVKVSANKKEVSDSMFDILNNQESLGSDSIFVETAWDCSKLAKIYPDLAEVIKCVKDDGKNIDVKEVRIINILADLPKAIQEASTKTETKHDIGDAYLGFRVLKQSSNKNSDTVSFPIGLTFHPITAKIDLTAGIPMIGTHNVEIPGGEILSGIPCIASVIDKMVDAQISLKLELSQTEERGVTCLELLLNVPKDDTVELNSRIRPIINI